MLRHLFSGERSYASMGFFGKILALEVVTLVIALAVGALWYRTLQPTSVSLEEISELGYWGPGDPKPDETDIKPFKINVSDEILDDLRDRLELIPDLTPPLEGVGFEYGFNSDYMKKVVKFWLNDYNWREREKYLNSFPQFTTQVAGLELHFVHARPSLAVAKDDDDDNEGLRVLPLLLLHGWPGSVREFCSLLPLLTTPRRGVAFEVVAPSLPGFGFSQGAARPGLGAAQMAAMLHSLMARLGHESFFVQGGDWGHFVGAALATLFPHSVLGFHTNTMYSVSTSSRLKIMLGSIYPRIVVDPEHESKVYPLSSNFQTLLEETGYFHLHATKPDTIGVALSDSPAGLAAYILEKFSTWTNLEWKLLPDGGLEKKFSLTDLLDNIMIYWISGSITTSIRLYSEEMSRRNRALQLDSIPTNVPTAVANFPNDLLYYPESIAKDKFPNLVHFSHMKRGGHFAAFEEPELLADDIWIAVFKMLKITER